MNTEQMEEQHDSMWDQLEQLQQENERLKKMVDWLADRIMFFDYIEIKGESKNKRKQEIIKQAEEVV